MTAMGALRQTPMNVLDTHRVPMGNSQWYRSSSQSSTPPTPESIHEVSGQDLNSIQEESQARSPTSVSCSECGLRRVQSAVTANEQRQRPHSHQTIASRGSSQWQMDAYCCERCLSTIRSNTSKGMANALVTSPDGTEALREDRRRIHRRRRTSLCHIDEIFDIRQELKSNCDEGLRVDREMGIKEAEKIARNIVQRSRRSSRDYS